jgi:hypothetical protein
MFLYTLCRSKSNNIDVYGKHAYIFLSGHERGNQQKVHSETLTDTSSSTRIIKPRWERHILAFNLAS